MDEMYSWLGRLAYDADNKGASGSIKKFLVKSKAMVPDLKVTVMGRRDGAESIEIYTGSRSKVVGQVESLGHLLVIDDPSLSRPISLGTVTTGYTDGFHRTTQVAAVPDGVQIGEVVTLMRKIQQVHDAVAATTRYIVVVGGDNIELPESSWSTWDEVFLSDDVARRVRDDLKFFLDNKKVFRDAGVPYKRGYLLCGPPGNGKSSIARAIATSMPFKSYMFDFSNTKLGNNDLSNAFRMAADDAPAVFFLEDIDRIFNHDHRDRTHITLDHLLNCLDGIRVNDGLIVVATANNPETLDPAIKSRPGRFDQVVTIENPGTELRHRYVQHLFRKTRVTDEAGLFGWLVDVTDGFSMAFLKEVFVSIVRNAVMTGDLEDGIARIDTEKAQVAAGDVLRQFGVTADKRKKAGFSR